VGRRARARSETKEIRAMHRELTARGIADRIVKLNMAVAAGSAFFWEALKRQIAAREFLRPIRDLEVVRALAVKILEADGYDLDGIVLKLEWRPPALWIEAQVDQRVAVEVVEAVRSRAAG
jgi:hypothetical protein